MRLPVTLRRRLASIGASDGLDNFNYPSFAFTSRGNITKLTRPEVAMRQQRHPIATP
jgi:hypothetical protein